MLCVLHRRVGSTPGDHSEMHRQVEELLLLRLKQPFSHLPPWRHIDFRGLFLLVLRLLRLGVTGLFIVLALGSEQTYVSFSGALIADRLRSLENVFVFGAMLVTFEFAHNRIADLPQLIPVKAQRCARGRAFIASLVLLVPAPLVDLRLRQPCRLGNPRAGLLRPSWIINEFSHQVVHLIRVLSVPPSLLSLQSLFIASA